MAKRNGTWGYCKPAVMAPPLRGPIGTVTQRKGEAAWRDIGQLFYKALEGVPKTYEYGKILQSDFKGKPVTL